jgi:hypothetical protein
MADINSNDNGPSGDKSRSADQKKDDRLSQDQHPRSPIVQVCIATGLVKVSAEVAH